MICDRGFSGPSFIQELNRGRAYNGARDRIKELEKRGIPHDYRLNAPHLTQDYQEFCRTADWAISIFDHSQECKDDKLPVVIRRDRQLIGKRSGYIGYIDSIHPELVSRRDGLMWLTLNNAIKFEINNSPFDYAKVTKVLENYDGISVSLKPSSSVFYATEDYPTMTEELIDRYGLITREELSKLVIE